jgi:hypothetical protein
MRAVNLIPAEQRAGAGGMTGRSDGGAYIVLALLAGVVLMAVLYGSARHQVSTKRKEVASVSAQASTVEGEANRLSSYTSFVTLHNERVQDMSQLIGTRFDWPHVFHELGRVLPTDVTLSSVQGSISGASATTSPTPTATPPATTASASAASASAVTSATPAGSVPTLTLTGCTVSQSEVAVTLARLRLINGVEEVHLTSSSKSGATSGGTGGGPCGSNAPTFNIVVSFNALPTPAATGSTASSSATAPASTPATTSTTVPGA